MSSKTCRTCGSHLPIVRFYRHDRMADGHLNHCKDCVKTRVKQHRADNLARFQEYDRNRSGEDHRVLAREKYASTIRGRRASAESKAKWRAEHAREARAHSAVARALRNGSITKQPCFICGSRAVEAHHPDYDSPLSVVWLCSKDHALLHKEHRERTRAAP